MFDFIHAYGRVLQQLRLPWPTAEMLQGVLHLGQVAHMGEPFSSLERIQDGCAPVDMEKV